MGQGFFLGRPLDGEARRFSPRDAHASAASSSTPSVRHAGQNTNMRTYVKPVVTELEHLEHEIVELASHIHAATCRWLMLVAEFDRREGWMSWGCKSCAHWVAWRC